MKKWAETGERQGYSWTAEQGWLWGKNRACEWDYKENVARNWKDFGLSTETGEGKFSEAKPVNTLEYSKVIHEGLTQGYAWLKGQGQEPKQTEDQSLSLRSTCE